MAQLKIKAVEMTRKIRDKHYQQLLGLSRAERLAFYREKARLMNEKAKKLAKRTLERA
ncbi:MAG: hypothetical protein N2559_09700 [Anaerolineae bacterium]|nr:hypothetical protein [Anaerolineae bacterium]